MRQRKVLILGGSSDIGFETVKLFLNHNWKVTAHFNSRRIILKESYKHKKSFSQFKFDLKKIYKFEKFLDKNKSKFGNFDAFVNLTGYLKPTTFEKFSIKDLYDHLNANSISSLLVIRKIILGMKKRKWGRIVNTSSIGTKFGGGLNNFAYSLSKFNNEFFPAYFKNVYSKNVIINSLQIGLTKTKILQKLQTKDYKKRVKVIPLNRMAKPSEVADYIFYLCNDKNKLLTGSVINISGGE